MGGSCASTFLRAEQGGYKCPELLACLPLRPDAFGPRLIWVPVPPTFHEVGTHYANDTSARLSSPHRHSDRSLTTPSLFPERLNYFVFRPFPRLLQAEKISS